MKNLILHIGNHKTGTTSIQKALFKYRDSLIEEQLYPFFEKKNGESCFSNLGSYFINNTGIDCGFEKQGAYVTERFYEDLADFSELNKTIIVSSEEFSFITDTNLLSLFKENIYKIFDKVTILVYLRRQDKQALSHHQQSARAPGAANFIYGNTPKALPDLSPNLDLYLNYFERIGMWGDAFGDSNLIIKNFDKNSLKFGSVVKDFFNEISSSIDVENIIDNSSLGKTLTKIKHLAIQVGYSRMESIELHKLISDSSEKMTPSLSEARIFLNHYSYSNKKMFKRFNLPYDFFEDSIVYPDNGNSLWNEEEVNGVLRELLKALKDK
jgi:hypothetical protein